MFPIALSLTALHLAISIAASPVEVRSSGVKLPFAKSINASGGNISLVQQDQTRSSALKERGFAANSVTFKRQDGVNVVSSSNITNQAVSYIASVGLGTPPTNYNLIVDTGFANTWVGADKPYIKTKSSHHTNGLVSLSYGTASFSGEEWLDTITLSDGLVGAFMSFGVANHTTGFNPGIDGVLGLGPINLTIGTLTNKPYEAIATITDDIYESAQGAPLEIVSVSFSPTNSGNVLNGELTFGGADPDKYTGEIYYTPITLTKPSSYFWGIDLSITYGVRTILSQTAGIIDTGSVLILIASDAYNAYTSATGGTEDAATGLLRLTPSQYENLEDLNFNLYSQTFTLTPNGQIWPRALNSYIYGSSSVIYSIVNDLGTPSGQGLDFVAGQAFVERFYSVFDTLNWQVGLATTIYTNATIN